MRSMPGQFADNFRVPS